jgi:hypothetical protein
VQVETVATPLGEGSVRFDGNSRMGQVFGYYFIDDYCLDNPYPGSVAGASIPGFDALFIGRAPLLPLGDNKVIGSNTVNEFHIGYLLNANIIGQPKGGLGVSLASQGFTTGHLIIRINRWRIRPYRERAIHCAPFGKLPKARLSGTSAFTPICHRRRRHDRPCARSPNRSSATLLIWLAA